jgi:hypothetical protein
MSWLSEMYNDFINDFSTTNNDFFGTYDGFLGDFSCSELCEKLSEMVGMTHSRRLRVLHHCLYNHYLDRACDNLVGTNEDEVGWGVCNRAGAGVAAHTPGHEVS